MIRGHELAYEYDKQNRRRDRDNSFYLDSAARNGRGGAYEISEPDDPDSVEIIPDQLRPGDANYEPYFKNKIEESIYRLKLENLYKNK